MSVLNPEPSSQVLYALENVNSTNPREWKQLRSNEAVLIT
jgi:hypothetical protein